jgi:hypothetical protein
MFRGAGVTLDLMTGDCTACRTDHSPEVLAVADFMAYDRSGNAADDGSEASAFALLFDLLHRLDDAAIGARPFRRRNRRR